MRKELLKRVNAYHPIREEEIQIKKKFMAFVESEENIFGKRNEKGHITGSAWIVNDARTHVLMTHHTKLNRWLQPGGHTEVDESVLLCAKREAEEECGLKNLREGLDHIFDLDIHRIPQFGNQGAHDHYDIRFLFYASTEEPLIITEESNALRWFELDELASTIEERSIKRMIEKTKNLD